MAWVPYNNQNQVGWYAEGGGAVTFGADGIVSYDGDEGASPWWVVTFDAPTRIRVTSINYRAGTGRQGSLYHPSTMEIGLGEGDYEQYRNEAYPYPSSNFPDNNGVVEFYPSPIEDAAADFVYYQATQYSSDYMGADEEWEFLVEVWDDTAPGPPDTKGYRVYELDRGWSFDGAYIPHYLELNWYFGEDPFTDKTIQKVRIHGLSKGRANLNLQVAGMQTEYDSDYTEGQAIPLPRNAAHITTDYIPVTNYVDSSNWGLSMQMKFEGSNTDLSKPEPSHVLQVLALQGSPQGNGKRVN